MECRCNQLVDLIVRENQELSNKEKNEENTDLETVDKQSSDQPIIIINSSDDQSSDDEPIQQTYRQPYTFIINDFQFLPERLTEIFDKEMYFYRKCINETVFLNLKFGSKAVKIQRDEKRKIKNAEPLSEEEIAEKETLLASGMFQFLNKMFQ